MKAVVKVCDLNTFDDISKIQSCMAQIQGVIACEISIERKEVQVVFNEAFVDLEKIIASLENIGFLVMV